MAATSEEVVVLEQGPIEEPPSPNPSTLPKPPVSQRFKVGFSLGSPGRSQGKGDPISPGGSPPGLIARLSKALSASISSLITPRPQEFDDSEIPQVFIDSCGGNRKKAHARWEADKKWRLENKMDRPHYKYADIKKYYPQYLQGRGVNNEIVTLEVPSKLDLAGLKKANVSAEDMAMHIAICFEYLFKVVDPSPNASCFTVMDLKDLSLTKAVSIDNIAIMRATADVVEEHYPGRLRKILIINPPWGFGTIFGVIKGVLPASVRDGIEIVYNVKDLYKHVAPDQLPKTYGGSGAEFGQSSLELDGRKFFLAKAAPSN